MKIIGSIKNKEKMIVLEQVDIQLKISEVDNLINFLKECKKDFIIRQQDCSVKKMILKGERVEIKKLSTYESIKELGCESWDCHLHYKDWNEAKGNLDQSADIVIHTTLRAKEGKNGAFIWENED